MKTLAAAVIGLVVLTSLAMFLSGGRRDIAPKPDLVDITTAEELSNQATPRTQPLPAEVPAETNETPADPKAAVTPIPVLRATNDDVALVSGTVDVLVSTQSSYPQKHEAWKRVKDAGKLDQVILELEQRMAANPQGAEYAAALGQAYLQKCGIIKDVREQGILAMQADKVFDAALALDPSNWEARFTKAVALSYWPPMLNKGEEVIQHFQLLVQQQETQPQQPEFAQTYIWLGDQYQKAGRKNDAQAVWERGAALFPNDEKLKSKLVPPADAQAAAN